MKNFERILAAMGLSAALVLGGCEASVGGDGDASTTDDAVADAGAGSDTTTGGDTTGGDTTTAKPTFKSILIFDKSEDPTFVNGKCGASPGSDLDAVALYRGGKLIAVGGKGTANYDTSSATTCDNKKNLPASIEGPLDGMVFSNKPDTGYISLNGGSIELQFKACSTATEDVKACDGAGAAVEIQDGDQIDVYEVDTTYLSSAKGGAGPQAGNAFDGCVCYADEFQISLRKEKGVDAGSLLLKDTNGSETFKGTYSFDANKKTIFVTVP